MTPSAAFRETGPIDEPLIEAPRDVVNSFSAMSTYPIRPGGNRQKESHAGMEDSDLEEVVGDSVVPWRQPRRRNMAGNRGP